MSEPLDDSLPKTPYNADCRWCRLRLHLCEGCLERVGHGVVECDLCVKITGKQ